MVMYAADSSHYQVYSLLAHCCNNAGSVHYGKHVPSKKEVAIKKYNMDKISENSGLIQQEIILTRQLQHPNILPYFTSFVLGPEVYIISPFMTYGSCNDLIKNNYPEGLPEAAIGFVLRDSLQGLSYIHQKGYIHRAFRASHILVSSSGMACLTGFKYACLLVKDGKRQKNTHSFPKCISSNLNWLSPELLEQNLQGYNEKSDVYSVGVTACELANGIIPFADVSTTLMLTEKVRGMSPQLLDCSTIGEDLTEIVTNVHNTSDSGVGDSVPSMGNIQQYKIMQQRQFSEAFHNFAELCMQRDPVLRPAVNHLLSHSFFKQCKRSSSVILPDLFGPSATMKTVNADSQDDISSLLVTSKMSQLDIETEEWDF